MQNNKLTYVKLSDQTYFRIIMGQSPDSEFYNRDKNGLPFYQGKADFGDTTPIPTVYCSKPKKVANPLDILISVRAPVGSVNIADSICCIGRGIAAIRCTNLDHVNLVYYYLKYIHKDIEALSSGATFGSIGMPELKSIRVPIMLNDKVLKVISKKLEKNHNTIQQMIERINSQSNAIKALEHALLSEVFLDWGIHE